MTFDNPTGNAPVLSWVDGRPVVNHASARREYDAVVEHGYDAWVVGGLGMEVPSLSRTGRWSLYMYNPFTGQHGSLDLGTDVVEPE